MKKILSSALIILSMVPPVHADVRGRLNGVIADIERYKQAQKQIIEQLTAKITESESKVEASLQHEQQLNEQVAALRDEVSRMKGQADYVAKFLDVLAQLQKTNDMLSDSNKKILISTDRLEEAQQAISKFVESVDKVLETPAQKDGNA